MALSSSSISNVATVFTTARHERGVVKSYPGEKPETLKDAYAIQDAALDRYSDRVIGWKVGGINGHWRETLGVSRLVGPVFQSVDHLYRGERIEMPVFEHGFAAIEGEVTAIIGADAPTGKIHYSSEDALTLIKAMHVGVEIASSPFSEINEHGPLVTISDFGNNFGLILGDEIPDWRELNYHEWVFDTSINGVAVGRSASDGGPGGPLESVRYLLENTARRGRPLKAGMKVLTGAVTGVHQAWAGDESCVSFNGGHEIRLKLVPFTPPR